MLNFFIIRFSRVALVALHDLFMAIAAFEIVLWTRYEILGAPQGLFFLWDGTIAFALTCAATFWWSGLYRGIWHYASLTDLLTIIRATTFGILLFLPVMFLTTRLNEFPRTSLILIWPLLILLLSIPRLLYRIIKDGNFEKIFETEKNIKIPVLIIGVGNEAERFIRETKKPMISPYKVVGIIDNSSKQIGRNIQGVRIWGNLSSLTKIIEKLNKNGIKPQKLIIASDLLSSESVKNLLQDSEILGLTVGRLPRITEFRAPEKKSQFQNVAATLIQPIAMEDLLPRPQQVLEKESMQKMIYSKRILVTGAGGTIGSELVRQIAEFDPESICLFDISEFSLYEIDLEVATVFRKIKYKSIIGDVRNLRSITKIFKNFKPEIVFHAAALKHVPLAEKNPIEAILTNIIGTKNVADACKKYNSEIMVLISTDKAVYPTSIMGVTKKIAEAYCQALSVNSRKNVSSASVTKFVVVRFGNVLGSTGSVVPLFQKQIASGGPITVTHPDATRYFMTKKEAVQLVLQASAIPENIEKPDRIFVLDMGNPVKIQNLARQLIRMAGLRPDKDIKITYTGLRSGEKVHEALFSNEEQVISTSIKQINQASPFVQELKHMQNKILELEKAAEEGKASDSIKIICNLVPDYKIITH